jgi:hypothetical protein
MKLGTALLAVRKKGLLTAMTLTSVFALAFLATACTPTGEGDFEILVDGPYRMGTDGYNRPMESPHQGTQLVRVELDNLTRNSATVMITFEALTMTMIEQLDNTRCENLQESRIRCVGYMGESSHSGQLQYTAQINGHHIESMEILELTPGPWDRLSDRRDPSAHWPRMVARFHAR